MFLFEACCYDSGGSLHTPVCWRRLWEDVTRCGHGNIWRHIVSCAPTTKTCSRLNCSPLNMHLTYWRILRCFSVVVKLLVSCSVSTFKLALMFCLCIRMCIHPFSHHICLFTKNFRFEWNLVYRGLWVIHDCMPYDPNAIHGQGHKPLKSKKN